jgi:serine/threonine protein kinase
MLANGTVLQSRYRIKRLIARGGMGAVYEAEDDRLSGKIVAVKETFFGEDKPHLLKQFQREAVTLARLRHRALPTVSDQFIEGTGQFLVMEFIPGDDLLTLLENQRKAFDVEQVIEWAQQILEALEYLHIQSSPVIHRDIKPQNLRLMQNNQIVLVDFGLAKDAAVNSSSGKSVYGYSPNFSPPEQIYGEGTDVRSDLYSLGATIYYLLTGTLPVDAKIRREKVKYHMADPLCPVHEVNLELPFILATIIARAMALDRENRFTSAAEFRQMLHHAREQIVEEQRQQEESRRIQEQLRLQEQARLREIEEQNRREEAERIRAAQQRLEEENRLQEQARQNEIQAQHRHEEAIRLRAEMIRQANERNLNIRTTPPPTNGRFIIITLLLIVSIGGIGLWGLMANPSPEVSWPEFITTTVDEKGQVISQETKRAVYFTEDIGEGAKLDMVDIPSGTFIMGSPESEVGREPNEGPQHNVAINSFWMGRFEVTRAQWMAVASLPKVNIGISPDPSKYGRTFLGLFFGDGNLPVESVTWNEVVEFCERLSRKTGKRYRLPRACY